MADDGAGTPTFRSRTANGGGPGGAVEGRNAKEAGAPVASARISAKASTVKRKAK